MKPRKWIQIKLIQIRIEHFATSNPHPTWILQLEKMLRKTSIKTLSKTSNFRSEYLRDIEAIALACQPGAQMGYFPKKIVE